MTENNPFVGATQEVLDGEDALTAALSNLAYGVTPARKPTGNQRRSRFWFKVETPAEVSASLKEAMTQKAIDHIDSEVQERLDSYREEAPPKLQSNIEVVREFFLKELAPLTLASSGGVIQATEVVQRLLDTEVDPNLRARFENMVNRATTLVLARFTLKYFNLPENYLDAIIGIPRNDSNQESLMRELLQVVAGLPSGKDFAKITSEIKKMKNEDAKR